MQWEQQRIPEKELNRYAPRGRDFIDTARIERLLNAPEEEDKVRLRDILARSLSIETLSLEETAYLLNVRDPGLREEMRHTAFAIKKKVYDNRIVTFAPLYMANLCVNDCLYCGFRKSNSKAARRMLTAEEVAEETKVLAGEIGHKRLIVVYGEHPRTDIDYMTDTIRTIYGVKVPAKKGCGQIRRVNVNAPPLAAKSLTSLHEVGIGTYQVFQETYHRDTYAQVHPSHTIKGDYHWRLYCMHRAFEAGIDDVGIGVLFGLYDWRFEVMGLLAHSIELERRFGIGPHTISFPRLEPAAHTPFTEQSEHMVSDEDFEKLITVLRLAVPYTGMIITARERAAMREKSLRLGITQTDASTKIGIGAYSDRNVRQEGERQQFYLGDTRSLDELIGEFARMGFITSFCTAGYRCGRTGKCIMDLLRSGQEGKFCKLNAVLTFREWLDDFASEETKKAGEIVIEKEIGEIKKAMPRIAAQFEQYYRRVSSGERDLYF